MPEYMKAPHRFRLWCAISHGHDLVEHDKGELVTFEDYQALLAYCTRLERELAKAVEVLKALQKQARAAIAKATGEKQ